MVVVGLIATPLVAPLFQVYVEAVPLPVNVIDDPAQIVEDGETLAVTVGNGFTVITTKSVAVQEVLASVKVTV